ncbi:MAG: thioredoxin family protein [Candidatus Micrarchaeia archaeon]
MVQLIDDILSFLSTPFNFGLVLVLLLLGLNVFFFMPSPQGSYKYSGEGQVANATLTIDFFFHPSCPHCKEQMGLNAKLAKEYSQIAFVYHDTSTQESLALLEQMHQKYNVDSSLRGAVPATFIGKQYYIGYDNEQNSGQKIRQMVVSELAGSNVSQPQNQTLDSLEINLPIVGTIKPAQFSLLALAVTLGLIDGFNPCAMWVLVYLISIVLAMKDRSRLWLIVGSFVLASGVLYFLFMTAWLNAFLFVGYFRPVTIIVGLVALGGGILSVKEFMQNPNSLECKVTGVEDKKKTMNSIQSLVSAPLTWATIFGVIVLAFSINSIEFVCSAAIPAIFTQVLALSNLSGLEYYFYILTYTLFFMFDDLIIFGLAAMAVSSDFGQKYAGYCHIIGGVIMLLLGIMLLFFPNVLA